MFDNVESYDLFNVYTPPNKGAMLLTTRSSRVAYAVGGDPLHIKLNKFSPDESLAFFNRVRRARDPQAAIEIEEKETRLLLKMMDGLPVGLKHMASYIAAKKMTIARFEQKYQRMAKHVLGHTASSTEQTLLKTWNGQFKDIHGSDACKLLGLLSLCRNEQIPRELFELEDHAPSGISSVYPFCMDYEEYVSR